MRSSMAFAILVGAVLIHGTAFGVPQDEDQQRCINAMNKGMAKTAKLQLKANAKCVADFARGNNLSASGCYAAPADVTASEQKTCETETKKCTTPPTLGPTGCSDINAQSDYEAHELADDLLGVVPDSGVKMCDTDPAGCRCQGHILKASAKLYSAIQKQFNSCKKQKLRLEDSPLAEPEEFNNCLAFDFQDKAPKASEKLLARITDSCSSTPVPFDAGDCAGLAGAALHACVESRVLCHVCINAQTADNFGGPLDCDNYDDGPVGSCSNDF
jgi:hypothetical protein